jgi:hypothetical protein
MKQLVLILTISSLLSSWCTAKHTHPEKYYQQIWCKENNGEIEYILEDKSRVDCITTNYAVELDFAPKWAECIGQALYYGIATNKKPVCLLIIEKNKDFKYYKRAKKVVDNINIDLLYIKANKYDNKNR